MVAEGKFSVQYGQLVGEKIQTSFFTIAKLLFTPATMNASIDKLLDRFLKLALKRLFCFYFDSTSYTDVTCVMKQITPEFLLLTSAGGTRD